MNIGGFLRWQFAGTLTNVFFYSFLILTMGMIALITGCPAPWPQILLILGIVITIGWAARSWVRCSYQIYQAEQRLIIKELERK